MKTPEAHPSITSDGWRSPMHAPCRGGGAPLRRPSMQGRTLYNVTMVDQNKRYCLRSIRHYSRGCGYRMLTALGKEVIEKFKELHPTFTQTWQSIRTKIINDRVNEL